MSAPSQASGSSSRKRKLSNGRHLSSSPTRRQRIQTDLDLHPELPEISPARDCTVDTGDGSPSSPHSKNRGSIDANALDPNDIENIQPGNHVEDLKANVKLRRDLERGFDEVSEYAKDVAALTDGRLGLKDLKQQYTKIASSLELYDDLVLEQLDRHIRSIETSLRIKQEKQDHMTIRLNHEANALSLHIRAVYLLAEDLDMKHFVAFKTFPSHFFEEFAECQELNSQRLDTEYELKSLRQEVDARQDEIHEMVVQVTEARRTDLTPQDEQDLLALQGELEDLKAAPDLLELEKSCDDQAERLDAIEKQLSQVETRLYNTVEEYHVAEGLLEALVASDSVETDHCTDTPKGCREPCPTPLNQTDGHPFDQRGTSRQLHRRLQKFLRQRYKASVRTVEECQTRLETLRLISDMSPEERALAERPDHAFFWAKAQRTQAVAEAENLALEILSSARDAGVSGIPAKSTGFSDQVSDGYSAGTIEAHVNRTDFDNVQQWIDAARSAKDHVDYANGDTTEIPEPSEPEQRPDLQPLHVGENYSTIATGKQKGRIDGWLVVQKPQMVNEKNVFRPSGRRMST